MWLTKSIVATALALTVSACATAHDSTAHDAKMPMQQGQMDCAKMDKHMKMMQNMDHGQMMKNMDHGQMMKNMDHGQMMKNMDHGQMSQMDMNDPAMKKAMMANMSKMQQMYQEHCAPNKSES
ncbi:hypothetical protein [Psychrobacter frigidicola]|uniref:hypothetical protein n=1 Tax=Psychrobacter frigidicola TaxID=45611 RepID=UPI0019199A47|nr:hypothetical protein [Psychrobacter frigidicola]